MPPALPPTHALLDDEPPLLLRPTLACVLAHAGLIPADRAALWVQQVHYWTEVHRREEHRERHYHDGRWWTWNSIPAWQRQFPFWSCRTVERLIRRAVESGLVLKGCYNRLRYDKTGWYAIDYDRLAAWHRAWQADAGRTPRQSGGMEGATLSASIPPRCGDGGRHPVGMEGATLGGTIPETIPQTIQQRSQEIWSVVLQELAWQVTRATYDQWLAPLALRDLAREGETARAVIGCGQPHVAAWCAAHLRTPIRRALAGVLGVPAEGLALRFEEGEGEG